MIPLTIGLYVTLITAISDHEEPGRWSHRVVPVGLTLLLATALVPLAGLAVRELALLAIVPLFLVLAWHSARARARPSSQTIGPLIGAAVKGLVLLDAAFLLGFGVVVPGLFTIGAWLVLVALGRVGLRT